MINVSNDYKYNIIHNLISNKLEITFPDHDCQTITEDNIISESMTLKQSICDESTLKFGGCIASEFDINIINTSGRTFDNSLVGKWISVKITQTFNGGFLYPANNLYPANGLYPGEIKGSQEFYIFSGIIDSAKVDKSDRNIRNLVAYDVMSKLFEWDGTNHLFSLWKKYPDGYKLNSLLSQCFNSNQHMQVSFINSGHFDEVINQSENIKVGDILTINKAWIENSSTISYGQIIKNICEMLGLFGAIRPNSGKGIFRFFALGNNEYTPESYDFYEQFYAEEFKSTGYTNIDTSIGGENRNAKTMDFEPPYSPDNAVKNVYDMTDNIIAWQKDDGAGGAYVHTLNDLFRGNSGKRMYNCSYTPITATLDGRLWVEVGDKIIIKTNKTDVYGNYVYDSSGNIITETVETFVLSRTITGIQALTDTIETKGGQ